MKTTRNVFCGLLLMLFASCSAQTNLKDATEDHFLFGVALNTRQAAEQNQVEAAIIKDHFSSIVAENCMKAAELQPEEGRWFFDDADRLVALGQKNKQAIIGHCLVWHSQLPRWFTVDENGNDVSPEVLKERMRTHIHTVMSRYKGKIHGYDVVNEAFNDNGTYRNSKFYQILGKDFIRLAFEYAAEADPDAQLYYNDYNMNLPKKCDAVVELVKELKAAGIRIDAVGMQGHMGMEGPSVEEFETSINKLAGVGVKVMVTEWDISILPSPYHHTGANLADRFRYSEEMDPYRQGVPAEVQAEWDARVLEMFDLFLKHSDVIDRVTVWGLSDGMSWKNDFPMRGRCDYPLLFDRNNQAKPVIQKMIKLANSK
ncbi:MAG TPA: endo-1,4-beta-xylanase [Bacteroidales bacterium]|nr:endo-1,4-beta-xylanase [Bacteroidales bacterium]